MCVCIFVCVCVWVHACVCVCVCVCVCHLEAYAAELTPGVQAEHKGVGQAVQRGTQHMQQSQREHRSGWVYGIMDPENTHRCTYTHKKVHLLLH